MVGHFFWVLLMMPETRGVSLEKMQHKPGALALHLATFEPPMALDRAVLRYHPPAQPGKRCKEYQGYSGEKDRRSGNSLKPFSKVQRAHVGEIIQPLCQGEITPMSRNPNIRLYQVGFDRQGKAREIVDPHFFSHKQSDRDRSKMGVEIFTRAMKESWRLPASIRKVHSAEESLETRIGAERVKPGVTLDKNQATSTAPIGTLQPLERRIGLPEKRVDCRYINL